MRLIEGRNNQIRNMFKHFGWLVEKLKRVRIGSLELGPLKPGEFRYLTRRGSRAVPQSDRETAGAMTIPELLKTSRTIAVVGLSSKRFRPSYGVAEYMQRTATASFR